MRHPLCVRQARSRLVDSALSSINVYHMCPSRPPQRGTDRWGSRDTVGGTPDGPKPFHTKAMPGAALSRDHWEG